MVSKWRKLKDPILSQKDILEWENEIGVKLPQDFITWYSEYDFPEGDWHIDVQGEPNDIDSFYLVKMVVREVEEYLEECEEYGVKGRVVPFAFDSALNQFCFFYPATEKPSGIFFRDRNDTVSELFDGDDIKETLYICKAFQDFLDRMYIYK